MFSFQCNSPLHFRCLSTKKHSSKSPNTPPPPPKKAFRQFEASQDALPPAFFSQTASKYAYIATCAAEELDVVPSTLFRTSPKKKNSAVKPPPVFLSSSFHYVSPKLFDYRLPSSDDIPELAVLGRSNVGKSTLLNAMMKKKGLAKVSKQPGRTQTVNYFGLFSNNSSKVQSQVKTTKKQKEMTMTNPTSAKAFLIDLPGYGYAKAPPKKVAEWQEKTQDFLSERSSCLKRVFVLLDSRIASEKYEKTRHSTHLLDLAVLQWLEESCIPYSIVLTKCDKSKSNVIKMVNEMCMRYHALLNDEAMTSENEDDEGNYVYQSPIIHVTSGKKGLGIQEILWMMNNDIE